MTGNKRMQEHGTHNNMNDYERSKRLRVQENQERLRQLGVKNIAKSFTSLVEGDKTNKRKKKQLLMTTVWIIIQILVVIVRKMTMK